MPSFNKVILVGHVTRDIELKNISVDMTVANFGLAMNHKWKTQGGESREEVCFVECAAFGKRAETISKYVKKGDPFMVEGRLKLDQWEDKKDGSKRSKLSVIVDGFQFLGGKGGKSKDAAEPAAGAADVSDAMPSDDIPF